MGRLLEQLVSGLEVTTAHVALGPRWVSVPAMRLRSFGRERTPHDVKEDSERREFAGNRAIFLQNRGGL